MSQIVPLSLNAGENANIPMAEPPRMTTKTNTDGGFQSSKLVMLRINRPWQQVFLGGYFFRHLFLHSTAAFLTVMQCVFVFFSSG